MLRGHAQRNRAVQGEFADTRVLSDGDSSLLSLPNGCGFFFFIFPTTDLVLLWSMAHSLVFKADLKTAHLIQFQISHNRGAFSPSPSSLEAPLVVVAAAFLIEPDSATADSYASFLSSNRYSLAHLSPGLPEKESGVGAIGSILMAFSGVRGPKGRSIPCSFGRQR